MPIQKRKLNTTNTRPLVRRRISRDNEEVITVDTIQIDSVPDMPIDPRRAQLEQAVRVFQCLKNNKIPAIANKPGEGKTLIGAITGSLSRQDLYNQNNRNRGFSLFISPDAGTLLNLDRILAQ